MTGRFKKAGEIEQATPFSSESKASPWGGDKKTKNIVGILRKVRTHVAEETPSDVENCTLYKSGKLRSSWSRRGRGKY